MVNFTKEKMEKIR